MNSVWPYTLAAISRNGRRTLVYLFGIVLAVGLLSSVLFYVDTSAGHMMQTALQGVRVDMQVVANSPDAEFATLEPTVLAQPHVLGGARFDMAAFSGSALVRGQQQTATSAGRIIAIPPSYLTTLNSIRVVQGRFDPQGILISKDMATNLGASPGDTVTLDFPSPIRPLSAVVTGIADLTGSDMLFAPTDSAHRGAGFNPPANVVVMDLAMFESTLQTDLMALPTGGTGSNTVVAPSEPAVSRQLHLVIDRSALPVDPVAAQMLTATIARSIEKQVPGQLVVLDNMKAKLDQVADDLLWAQVIFLFLAVPGILLAANLSRYAAASLIEAQRNELALLRARGASPLQIVMIVAMVSFSTALIGAFLGLLVGLFTNVAVSGLGILSSDNTGLLVNSGVIALVVGLILAAGATFVPARALYLDEVSVGRQAVHRVGRPPLWHRLYLDVVALAAGIGVLWLTQRNGFAPVLGAEGQLTLSLSVFTFLAPLLIWLGAALLLSRVGDLLLKQGTAVLGSVLRRLFGVVGDFSARSIARRSKPLVQPALIVALTLSFGISLSVFEETYHHQQLVDAQLTLGADVVVTPGQETQKSPAFANLLQGVPGVAHVSPFTASVAYVGTELQDIFGVDSQTFLDTTQLSDAFFVGETAQQMMTKLAAIPNGILISPEMAQDYNIASGDTVKIRLLNQQTQQYVTVPFQVVGVVREFATAPKDAFLVVNRPYLSQLTGTDAVSLFLVSVSGDPRQTAEAIQARFSGSSKLQVQSVDQVAAQLATSITSLNLAGLAAIEWGYVVVIASLGLMIFLIGILGERCQEYAALQALGASPAQLRSFLLAEAGVVSVTGLLIGLAVGFPLAQVIVTILSSIFDPPPAHLFISWPNIGLLFGLSIIGLVLSVAWGARRLQRLEPAVLLREL
jgi:putative ABC transport system permease protein